MRKLGLRIFDELVAVAGGSSTTTDAYTSLALNEVLGRYDQLAIQAVVENVVTASGSVTIQFLLETSCSGDSRTWVQKTTSPVGMLDTTKATVLAFPDVTGMPSYALVRVHVKLMCTTAASAHVRLFAAARDTGAHDLRGTLPGSAYYWMPPPHFVHVVTPAEVQQQLEECKKTHPNKIDCLDL
jgi:hypothetical protein